MPLPVTHKNVIQRRPHIILEDVLCVPASKLILVSMGKVNLQNSYSVVGGTTTYVT